MRAESADRHQARDPVGRSLGPALAIYLTAIVVLATLAPFRLSWPPRWSLTASTVLSFRIGADLFANVSLFVPIGFVFRLCQDRRTGWAPPILASLVLSTTIELLQTVIPPRVCSPIDVLANVAGAALGLAVFEGVVAFLDRRRVKELALELPLATVFYLLLPVLWMNALLLVYAPARVWLTVPLGLIAGLVLGSIGHHRVGPPGVLTPMSVTMLVGVCWGAVGLAGAIHGTPETRASIVWAGLSTMGAVFVMQWMPALSFGTSRRFEGPCLWRVLPLLTIYVLTDGIYPMRGWESIWEWRLGFDDLEVRYGVIPLASVFAILEHATSYVLLGFVLAGLGGRSGRTTKETLWVVGLIGGLGLTALEVLRGFHIQQHASLAHAILGLGSMMLGAYLYRSHLVTVCRILNRPPAG
jgi:glycopeptide antibiotics resistance protein